MALLAISVNIAAKRYPRLWSAEKLPSDATTLVPVRSGGTLVLCQHLVLFYTQVHQPLQALLCMHVLYGLQDVVLAEILHLDVKIPFATSQALKMWATASEVCT